MIKKNFSKKFYRGSLNAISKTKQKQANENLLENVNQLNQKFERGSIEKDIQISQLHKERAASERAAKEAAAGGSTKEKRLFRPLTRKVTKSLHPFICHIQEGLF